MKRGLFLIVIAIVVIVILAAVLGGVLGTVLNKNHSSSNLNDTSSTSPPIQALAGTGLATTIVASGTGRILMYYQDDQSRIIENSYFNDTWTLQDDSNLDQSVVVASMAQQGSPMAAIAYERNGTNYRQVFFLDASGTLHETNSSTVTNGIATSWSQPQAITSTIASPKCISIAACVNSAPMNGIRVYFGAADAASGKFVQETLFGFDQQIWKDGSSFPEGDADSGIGCGAWNSTINSSQYVDLYFRNVTSGVVLQEFWDYSTNGGWNYGPVASAGVTMMEGGSLAVCDDQADTEYIYWPLTNGTLVRGYLSPDTSNNFDGYALQEQTVSSGTNFASTWTGDGALLLYQNSTNASTVWMAEVARNGQVIVDAAVV
nr:hypothetical protein CFP56_52461 [Quercus suber]